MSTKSPDQLREANHAVMTAYFDAWLKGDAATLVNLYADDIVLHYFGQSALAGDHRGKPSALAALQRIGERTNRQPISVHDIVASPDHVVVLLQERWEREGRKIDLNRVLVYHLRDGKIIEAWAYDENQRTVDEFWSS